MPTYEYRCSSCGRTFDAVQSFSDAPLTTCEVCGGELKRVFHPVGIVLKGSGFYSTDNRSGKNLSPSKKDDASSSSSDPSSGSTTTSSESSKPSKPSKPSTSSKADTSSGSAASS